MRRFSANHSMMMRLHNYCRSVLDILFSVDPRPVASVLLSDVSWKALTEALPRHRLHQACSPKDEPIFTITEALRTMVMMPVTSVTAHEATTKWVPFLVDTGSPNTYFAAPTRAALGLDNCHHLEVLGKRIQMHSSSHHFEEINLLGTDVLKHGTLTINYPSKTASFNVHAVGYRLVSADGKLDYGVFPTGKFVKNMKEAIARVAKVEPRSIKIRDPNREGKYLGDDDALEMGVTYVYYPPSR